MQYCRKHGQHFGGVRGECLRCVQTERYGLKAQMKAIEKAMILAEDPPGVVSSLAFKKADAYDRARAILDAGENGIITKGGTDRRQQLCRCSRCQEVGVCTPHTDYYEVPDDPTNGIYCEGCFRMVAGELDRGETPKHWS